MLTEALCGWGSLQYKVCVCSAVLKLSEHTTQLTQQEVAGMLRMNMKFQQAPGFMTGMFRMNVKFQQAPGFMELLILVSAYILKQVHVDV